MKVLTVVGARPQFVKAFPVSRALGSAHEETLVHTGQHYDEALSAVFFDELDIPEPAYQLGVGSAPPGEQIGRMMIALEPVIEAEAPDVILVYGDTNSTLAAAMVAAKAEPLLGHIEAGLRSGNRLMPEEINRVLTDHASDLLFAPTARAVGNLSAEGIEAGVHRPGDVMYDAILWARRVAADRSTILGELGLRSGDYVLATIHRAANTDRPDRLRAILGALGALEKPVIFPAHPRTVDRLRETNDYQWATRQVRLIEPLSYLDFVRALDEAWRVATDSGGVQKEAFFLDTPCVTLREETEWPETVAAGGNVLTGADPQAIQQAFAADGRPHDDRRPFGDGHAAEAIVERLEAAVRRSEGVRPRRAGDPLPPVGVRGG